MRCNCEGVAYFLGKIYYNGMGEVGTPTPFSISAAFMWCAPKHKHKRSDMTKSERYWRIQWAIAVTDDKERKLLAEQEAMKK